MIKLANSAGNHHKKGSSVKLGGTFRGNRFNTWSPTPCLWGDSSFLDGLLWQSFNHPKGENVRNYPQYEHQQI